VDLGRALAPFAGGRAVRDCAAAGRPKTLARGGNAQDFLPRWP